MKRFKLLLLDANVIIELMRVGKWDVLVNACEVYVGEVVLGESHFFVDTQGDRRDFDLEPYVQRGDIRMVAAQLEQVRHLDSLLTRSCMMDIHAGEKELLAIMCSSNENWMISAADAALVRVVAGLGREEQLISLETLLLKIGHQAAIREHFGQRKMEKWIAMGKADAIQGGIRQ